MIDAETTTRGKPAGSVKPKELTSWDKLGWVQDTAGRRFSFFTLPERDGEPCPYVATVHFPPGFVVDPHTHRTDYAEILLSGTLSVDRSELVPGDVRIVRAGTGYGPQIAGPEGCDLILVYRDADPAAVPLNDKRLRGLTYDIDRSASTVDWEPPA